MKGLVCAGGEATRLGELTRVANKHLLPVGSWPMIYYPLQLLQRAGVREVLLVTGKGHAGQMIDLLGDGRVATRGTGEPLLELDLSYKVQTEPGGIAQVVGMAREFAAGGPLVVVLGDNVFEHCARRRHRGVGEARRRGARSSSRTSPDPEAFGVVVYGDDGRVTDIVEKAGVVDTRYERPPTSHAVVGLYCYPADVFEVIDSLEPSSRGELEITDVNRHYAQQGRLEAVQVRGWWEDAGKHWHHLAEIGRLVDETGANGPGLEDDRRMIEGLLRIPLRRVEDERGWFSELRRESTLPRPTRQTNVSFSRAAGDSRAPLPPPRPGRPLRLPAGHGQGRRPRPRHGRGVQRGHRRREPGRDLHPRPPRTRLRGPHRSPVLLPRDRGVRPGRAGRARAPLGRSARQAPVEHTRHRSSRRGTARRCPERMRVGEQRLAAAKRPPSVAAVAS